MNATRDASDRATRTLVWVFLLAWVSQLVYLMPVSDLAKFGSADAVEATKAAGWIITAGLIAFGMIAGIVALKRRIGIGLMLISSLAYVVTWWLFSGYFDVQMSMAKMFADLWSAAKTTRREVIFLHRDIVLNVFYHLMVPFLAYVIFRGRARTATT
jgi:hypothetical protein